MEVHDQPGKSRIKQLFESWSDIVSQHDKWIVVICSLIVLILGLQLSSLTIDTDIENFLYDDDPDLMRYDSFRDEFGRDDRIVVGISTDRVFNKSFLRRLADFHEALEESIPYLDEVESLINARAIYGSDSELVIEELFEQWPESDADWTRIEDYAGGNPLYDGVLISPRRDFTLVFVRPLRYRGQLSDEDVLAGFSTDDSAVATEVNPKHAAPIVPTAPLAPLGETENDEIIAAIYQVMEEFESENFKIYASGQPILSYSVKTALKRDMPLFVGLSFLVIGLALFILFRTLSAIIAPLLVVIFSLVSTLGCMAFAGIPLQVPTQILPSFLIAVGVADSIHILAIFQQRLRKGDHKEAALRNAMGHAGVPVLFTSFTTAGGLVSFAGAPMAPVAYLGLLAPIGVAFAFIYSIVLLPALISILPTGKIPVRSRATRSSRALVSIGRFSLRNPWKVLSASIVMIILSLFSISTLHFSHNPINYLQASSPMRVATQLIDSTMSGTMSMEVLIDLNEDNSFKQPKNLNKLELIVDEMAMLEHSHVKTGKQLSINNILKEINKSLNSNQDSAYTIPQDQALVSQELLLFENSGSDDILELVDSQFSKARITLMVNWTDALQYVSYVERTKAIIGKYYQPEQFYVTGLLPILSATFLLLIQSVSNSYMLAMLIIIPLMMLMVRSIKIGALAMLPNLLPIILCLGYMGVADVPIDAFSMLIGGVALGLVVDDSIHFLHHFSEYYRATQSVDAAVERTLETTGAAMLFTTLTLAGGFSVFLASSMQNLNNFGLLTAMAIVLALLADIVLMPAIIAIFYNYRPDRS